MCSSFYCQSRCRRAFSLVEVLVVIGIIGLLVAVLLPAVNAARESARRVGCQNNIRQISLACISFHDQNRHFPVGRFYGPKDHESGPNAKSWSWMADILPLVEMNDLYHRGGIPKKTHRASGVASAKIELFLCPSMPSSYNESRSGRAGMKDLVVGMTNYHAVSGSNWGADGSQNQGDVDTDWRNKGANGSFDGLGNGDGMMYRSDYRKPRRLKHVRDGSSHTFLIGEVDPKINRRVSWPYANNAYSTCAIPLNLIVKDDGRHDPDDWENINGFRSTHFGGGYFAFVDGSVRFVNDSIDLDLYRALATVAGRERGTFIE